MAGVGRPLSFRRTSQKKHVPPQRPLKKGLPRSVGVLAFGFSLIGPPSRRSEAKTGRLDHLSAATSYYLLQQRAVSIVLPYALAGN